MKGQSSLEFLAMVSMSTLLVAALSGFIAFKNQEAARYRNSGQASRIAQNFGFQVEMALVQGEGYSRVFSVPEDVGGESYNITIDSGYVVVDYLDRSHLERTLYNESRIETSTYGGNTFRVLHNDSGVFVRRVS